MADEKEPENGIVISKPRTVHDWIAVVAAVGMGVSLWFGGQLQDALAEHDKDPAAHTNIYREISHNRAVITELEGIVQKNKEIAELVQKQNEQEFTKNEKFREEVRALLLDIQSDVQERPQ